LLLPLLSFGCSLFGGLIGPPVVSAERIEPGGKGLFVIRPPTPRDGCEVKVASQRGALPVGCESQFVVGCDASIPESRPFCMLMREKGPVRESIYPAASR
jgi:hypothetical protein